MNEEWKIAVFRNVETNIEYQISSYGRLMSMGKLMPNGGYSKPKILKPQMDRFGYMGFRIKGKHCKIHQIVADTFIPNPNNYSIIDHINGDKTDNRVSNLRRVTYKENSNNPNTHWKFSAWQKGVHKSMERLQELNKVKIEKYSISGEYITTYSSIKEAAKDNKILTSGIIRCAQGQYKSSGGFTWKYVYNDTKRKDYNDTK